MKITIWSFCFAALLSATNYTYAQQNVPAATTCEPSANKAKHHKANPEMKAALKEHFQQKMLPILQERHQQFDGALSKADLQFLNEKRQEARQIGEQKRALHQQHKQAKLSGKTEEEIKALLQPQHEQIRAQKEALAQALQPFIDRNRSIIDKFVSELQPLHEQWRSERHAIREQYRPADAPPQESRPHHEHGHHKGGAPDKATHQIVRFLLWDGQEPDEDHHHHDRAAHKQASNTPTKGQEANTVAAETSFSVFPNPATDNATAKFSLATSVQTATLQVFNQSGQVVQSLRLGGLSAGAHSAQINLHELPAGQYLCVLQMDGNQQTTQLVIKR